MNDDLTIPVDEDTPAPSAAPIERLTRREAEARHCAITYLDTETNTITTLGGPLVEDEDEELEENEPWLRCQGQVEANPATAMGLPGTPTPVIAPTPRARKAMAGLPVLTHSAAIAQTRRPLTYRDAATNVITTLN
jgi:hypothetical protein